MRDCRYKRNGCGRHHQQKGDAFGGDEAPAECGFHAFPSRPPTEVGRTYTIICSKKKRSSHARRSESHFIPAIGMAPSDSAKLKDYLDHSGNTYACILKCMTCEHRTQVAVFDIPDVIITKSGDRYCLYCRRCGRLQTFVIS